jgi:hypothetical protein
VLVSHGYVFVGAPGDDGNRGAVHVFDENTGAELTKLTASDPEAGDFFGTSLAAEGGILVIGAPFKTVGLTGGAGVCYVFRIGNAEDPLFTEIQALSNPSLSENAGFGQRVVIGGGQLLVSEPFHNGQRGRVTQFRVQDLVFPLSTSFTISNSEFGTGLAASNWMVASGAPQVSGAGGRVVLQSTVSTSVLALQDGTPDSEFGQALAMFGNRLAVGAPKTGAGPFNQSGFVTVYDFATAYDSVALNGEVRQFAKTGDPAPGGGTYGKIGLPAIGVGAAVLFEADYRQRPNPGVTRAVFGNAFSNPLQRLLARLDPEIDAFASPGARLDRFLQLRSNSVLGIPLIQTRLSGASGASRNAIYTVEGGQRGASFLGGYNSIALGGAVVSDIAEVSQAFQAHVGGQVFGGMLYRLQRSAANGVSRANDEGFLTFRQDGNTTGVLDVVRATERKGEAGPGGIGTYVSVRGPHTFTDTNAYTIAELDTAGVRRQVVAGGAGVPVLTWDAQNPVPGVGGVDFSRFVGIGSSAVRTCLRATLKGPGINSRTNEGLWFSGVGLAVRKGDAVPGQLPGVRFSRFLGVWNTDSAILILAKIAGPGVKGNNDLGLWQWLPGGSLNQLIREGDLVGTADGARVRTIQRVDLNSNAGWYSVLVSLTGNKTANQAFLKGKLQASTALGLPYVEMRKGLRVTSDSNLSAGDPLRGMQMLQVVNRFGIGTWGGAKVINNVGYTAVLQRLGRQGVIAIQ